MLFLPRHFSSLGTLFSIPFCRAFIDFWRSEQVKLTFLFPSIVFLHFSFILSQDKDRIFLFVILVGFV